jgi:hypothetical protein
MKRSANADGTAARPESGASESLGIDTSALRKIVKDAGDQYDAYRKKLVRDVDEIMRVRGWSANADGEAARSEAGVGESLGFDTSAFRWCNE